MATQSFSSSAARDDALPVVPSASPSRTLYVDVSGGVVRKRRGRIVVERCTGDDREEVLSLPAVDVERVVLVGRVHCTSSAQRFFLEEGIPTTLLAWNGRLLGQVSPAAAPNPALRLAQYRASSNNKQALNLARRFVAAKLSNQRTLMQRYARRRSSSSLSTCAHRIHLLSENAEQANDLDALRGLEGQATKLYYEAWDELLQHPDPVFTLPARTRRPPEDPVNALLSFCSTLLQSDVQTACRVAGLDPYVGSLHGVRYNCPSCALDLMEAFRPTVADSVVLSIVNQRRVDASDFRPEDEGVYLTESGRKVVYDAYETRRQTEVTPPGLGQSVPYHRAFEGQARLLARALTDRETYAAFTVR